MAMLSPILQSCRMDVASPIVNSYVGTGLILETLPINCQNWISVSVIASMMRRNRTSMSPVNMVAQVG